MTASVLQSGSNSATATTVSATLSSTPTVGNTLVVIANSDSTLTITGTWTSRFSAVNDQGFYIWERAAVASDTTTFTVTPGGGADYTSIAVFELAGVSGFDVVGTNALHNASATTATATSVTTTAANDLVLAAFAQHGYAGSSVPTSPTYNNTFTGLINTSNPFPSSSLKTALFVAQATFASAGATGATTCTWSQGTDNQSSVMIAYKAAATGSGATVQAVAAGALAGVSAPTANADSTVSGQGAASALAAATAPTVTVTSNVTVAAPASVALAASRAPAVSTASAVTVQAVAASALAGAVPPTVGAGVTVQAVAGSAWAGAGTASASAGVAVQARAGGALAGSQPPAVSTAGSVSVQAVAASAWAGATPPTLSVAVATQAPPAGAFAGVLAPTVSTAGTVTVQAVAGAAFAAAPVASVSAQRQVTVVAVPGLALAAAFRPSVTIGGGIVRDLQLAGSPRPVRWWVVPQPQRFHVDPEVS